MKHNPLYDLNKAKYATADVLVSAEISDARLKKLAWSGTFIFAEDLHPGRGNSRLYTILDIYGTRLMVALGEACRISPSDAVEIVNEAIYTLARHPESHMTLAEVRHQYRSYHDWPNALKDRDLSHPWYLVACHTKLLGWQANFVRNDLLLTAARRTLPSPPLPSGGNDPRVGFVCLNVTSELKEVDRILEHRLRARPRPDQLTTVRRAENDRQQSA
jgi:hypothetical protein